MRTISDKPFHDPIFVTRPLLPDLSEYQSSLEEIWSSRWLSNNGDFHRRLENEICKILSVPNSSLFNNGTIALIVAVQSMRLMGDVITTPFTFPATPHVLTWNNINPIFCDIDNDTLNIDATKIESLITPKTTGILAVHIFGTPCDVERIQNIADTYGLKVIYDAAHAFQTEINGKGIGTFGDISMFSFHATKLFHSAEGGALTYNDPDLKQRIEMLKNFGLDNTGNVVMPGINGKMNEIQAALGLLVLRQLEEERKKRTKLKSLYMNLLNDVDGITFVKDEISEKQSLQYLVIRINPDRFGISRDEIWRRLQDYNVFTKKYFHPLCSAYPCYKQLHSANPANLPVAYKIAEETLMLPFYGELPIDDAERIANIIKSFRR